MNFNLEDFRKKKKRKRKKMHRKQKQQQKQLFHKANFVTK